MEFNKLIEAARRIGASDIHILADMPPCFRVHGEIKPAQSPALTAQEIGAMVASITNPIQQERLKTDWELCTSMMIENQGRIRVTFYMRAGAAG